MCRGRHSNGKLAGKVFISVANSKALMTIEPSPECEIYHFNTSASVCVRMKIIVLLSPAEVRTNIKREAN